MNQWANVTPEEYRLSDDGRIPNHPELPALIYRGVLASDISDPAAVFEAMFTRNGWPAAWRNGIYPFAHFHSNAHEVLGIAQGSARVRLGGEHGVNVELNTGDAVVLPAGTGHQRLDDTPGLLVVGAYPQGQQPDLCRGEAAEHARAVADIARVEAPERDPVTGSPWQNR